MFWLLMSSSIPSDSEGGGEDNSACWATGWPIAEVSTAWQPPLVGSQPTGSDGCG